MASFKISSDSWQFAKELGVTDMLNDIIEYEAPKDTTISKNDSVKLKEDVVNGILYTSESYIKAAEEYGDSWITDDIWIG
jgi:hypothetical protein